MLMLLEKHWQEKHYMKSYFKSCFSLLTPILSKIVTNGVTSGNHIPQAVTLSVLVKVWEKFNSVSIRFRFFLTV